MKIFFSVGEPSGDLHGANLIRELQNQIPDCECVGFGGPRMREAGCEVLFDLTTLAVMFLTEVFTKLPKFFALKKQARMYFESERPDAVVLIDFPGFNWHIAKVAKQKGIPVFYYGVPQMWAWAPWRIGKLKRTVDHVLCKLPFEPDWFRKRGVNAEYVGHPYFDELDNRKLNQQIVDEIKNHSGPTLTLLPGSRDQEVEQNGRVILQAAAKVKQAIPDLKIAAACFKQKHADRIHEWMKDEQIEVELRVDQTPELIEAADMCLACSGSVSLELMYHQKPTVIVFRVSQFKMRMAKILLQTKFITLVNLMATSDITRERGIFDPDAPGSEPVPFPEYLTTKNVSDEASHWLIRWMRNPKEFSRRVSELFQLNQQFAKPGASLRAAEYIARTLSANSEFGSATQKINEDSIVDDECQNDAA